ncbi:penicillin-binding protein 2 [Ekhidna lutea]|uniref:Penicillin-binding protein 2 n=1 Tax=Ekhidna lutea TaxID=447679 RepID=A0A239EUD4_EKHLU|nr:penicillin-binding transpeptidase domain-containing protein [Ekhidna lutea]SNS48207.1 penicillin-binding protein 2 [Ekhidna lutea]
MRGRSLLIRGFILFTAIIFAARLFYIQILEEDYKVAAENNVVQKIVQYPFRGLVYDSNDSLVIYNSPVYDLMIVPKEAEIGDTTAFCDLLEIEKEQLKEKLNKAKNYSSILASKLIEQISEDLFAKLQDQLINYPGFYVLPRTIRSYNTESLANVVGYVGEVSSRELNRDTTNYYRSGDYIGIGGIEKSYEEYLRGRRGSSYKVVNVQGVIKGDYRDGEYDTLPKSGENIHLTIDLELQQYAEKLMEGKVGSVVAIEPKTGRILALVSAPSYDPQLLSGKNLSKNFPDLNNNKDKPLFNRPLQARYPPGSMFKTIQGIIAMHEEVVSANEIIRVDHSNIGDLAPPGPYDMVKAITKSSNNYFYLIMRRMVEQGAEESQFLDARIGLEKWRDYVKQFGLGRKLGVDLPNEITGNVPSLEYYDRVYGAKRWKYSNIASLSIGQGELLVTPLQMANLGAILANKGYFITPHVVDKIEGWPNPNIKKEVLPFNPELFEPVLFGMEQVVKGGSGIRGYLDTLKLAGKTSTVQNPHGEDHSGFMGFAPLDNPKISIAAYVENAGQGGRAAVSVASLLAEKYVLGKISRPWLETYVLEERYLPENAPRPTLAEN